MGNLGKLVQRLHVQVAINARQGFFLEALHRSGGGELQVLLRSGVKRGNRHIFGAVCQQAGKVGRAQATGHNSHFAFGVAGLAQLGADGVGDLAGAEAFGQWVRGAGGRSAHLQGDGVRRGG